MDETKGVIGAIMGTASLAGTGSVTVASITAPAPGILGAVGLTTTTTVASPVAGIVGAACLLGYGAYKGFQWAQNSNIEILLVLINKLPSNHKFYISNG